MRPLALPSVHTMACMVLASVGIFGILVLLPKTWPTLDPLSRGVVIGMLVLLGLGLGAVAGFTLWARHQSQPAQPPRHTSAGPRFLRSCPGS